MCDVDGVCALSGSVWCCVRRRGRRRRRGGVLYYCVCLGFILYVSYIRCKDAVYLSFLSLSLSLPFCAIFRSFICYGLCTYVHIHVYSRQYDASIHPCSHPCLPLVLMFWSLTRCSSFLPFLPSFLVVYFVYMMWYIRTAPVCRPMCGR